MSFGKLLNMPETLDMPLRPASPATSPLRGEELAASRVRVLSVLVEDGQNTLTKIAGAVRRRGFHIRGLSIGPTREAGRSRITLEVDHGHAEADQVRKQLERLVEVVEVVDLTGDEVHSRELIVAKVKSSEAATLATTSSRLCTSSPVRSSTSTTSTSRSSCLRTWSASAWPWSICSVIRERPRWRLGPTEIPRT